MKWFFLTFFFGILGFSICLEKFQELDSPAVAMMSGKVPLTEYCVMFSELITNINIQNIPRHEEKIIFVNNLFAVIFISLTFFCLFFFLKWLKKVIKANALESK